MACHPFFLLLPSQLGALALDRHSQGLKPPELLRLARCHSCYGPVIFILISYWEPWLKFFLPSLMKVKTILGRNGSRTCYLTPIKITHFHVITQWYLHSFPALSLHLFVDKCVDIDMSRSPFSFAFLITLNDNTLHTENFKDCKPSDSNHGFSMQDELCM